MKTRNFIGMILLSLGIVLACIGGCALDSENVFIPAVVCLIGIMFSLAGVRIVDGE